MMRRIVLSALLAALAVGLAILPAPVSAETITFVGSSFRSCWEDTEGFTSPPDLQPNPLPGGTPPGTHFLRLTTSTNAGTTIFDTNGTVTSTDSTTTSIRNTTTGRVNVSQVDCTGTWSLDPATLRVSTDSTCSFENTIGGASTGTTTSQALYQLAGTTLVRINPPTPVVETVNVLTGPGAPFSYQRVCAASGALHLSQ
jgi:hypothetical protein